MLFRYPNFRQKKISHAQSNFMEQSVNCCQPWIDGSRQADIIISNCVVNLPPYKFCGDRYAYRILKPGGRIAISDILTTAPLPEKIKKDLELLTACVGGAQTFAVTKQILKEAGFKNITIKPQKISQEILGEWALPMSENVANYIVSATIEAVK